MTTSCSSASKTSTPISRGSKPALPSGRSRRQDARSPTERPSLPAHLPREDVRLDVEHRPAPAAAARCMLIGETVSEMLDHVPARLRVIRIRRPRYGCRACGTIHQAPAPERPIAKGLASPGLLAHVLVAKYCDHLPLYRQSQIFARHGVELDRSTLANWVGGACWWLEPLQARLAEHVFASQKLFADDTPIPVLDPGRGRTKTGRLWVYARDDRPWDGPDPPAAVYLYSPDRRAERPPRIWRSSAASCRSTAIPGSSGSAPAATSSWRPAGRMRGASSTRCTQATGSPIAAEALRRIAELYAIETTIRGQPADSAGRRRGRSSRCRWSTAMKAWLETELTRIPPRSGLAEAIRYALARWERSLPLPRRRPHRTRHQHRRARHPARSRSAARTTCSPAPTAAPHAGRSSASLIATAKLNDVEPFAYLKDVLERMSDGHPMSRLDDLLPWNWAPAKRRSLTHVSEMERAIHPHCRRRHNQPGLVAEPVRSHPAPAFLQVQSDGRGFQLC